MSLTREPPTTTAIPGPTDPAARRRIWALLAVAVVCVAAFGVVAAFLKSHGWTSPFDQGVNLLMRNLRNPWTTQFMWVMSLPGDPPVIAPLTVVASLVLAIWGWRSGAVLLALTMVSEAAVQSLESSAFARPRPPAEFALIQRPTTLSFPSGHAWASLLLASVLGLVLWRTLPKHRSVRVVIVCAVVVVAMLVGVSRVYLGVHWPSDVAGGWMMAVVSLVVARAIYLWVVKRFCIKERGSTLGPGWFRIAVTALGVVLAVGLLVYDAGLNPLLPRGSQGQGPRAHAATDVTRSPDRPTSARERQATCA